MRVWAHIWLIILVYTLIIRSLSAKDSIHNPINSHGTILLHSKIDSFIDLHPMVNFWIDYPPFKRPDDILKNSFYHISLDSLNSLWQKEFNFRIWAKLTLTNTDSEHLNNLILFPGMADRILYHKIENNDPVFLGTYGLQYRNHIKSGYVQQCGLPISLESKDTETYLIQLSSSFISDPAHRLEIKIFNNFFADHWNSKIDKTKYIRLFYALIISIFLFLFILTLILFIQRKELVTGAFLMIIIAFTLYFLRDFDFLSSQFSIYPSWEDFSTKTEPLGRALIHGSILLFAFVFFKNLQQYNYLIKSSLFVFSFGLISGLWFLLSETIQPYNHYTSWDMGVYITFIAISQINTITILVHLWKKNTQEVKIYITAILILIAMNYGGLFKDFLIPQFGELAYFGNYSSIIGTLLFLTLCVFLIIRRSLLKVRKLIIIESQHKRTQEVAEAKSRLYSNITHEFRTPLTIIIGALESIKSHKNEKALIQQQSNSLLHLVNELLEFSKSEFSSSKGEHNIEGNIIPLMEYLHESFSSIVTSNNITLEFKCPSHEIIMSYNENNIQHLASNLISNAIKFTPPYGKINSSIHQSEGYLVWNLKDSGIGIANDEQDKIFDRYYRTSNSSQIEGTGLGLAVTKEIIHSMNGTIDVQSNLDEGTEFIIRLPINLNPKIEIGRNPKDYRKIEIEDLPCNIPIPEFAQDDEIVLIVEDNHSVLEYISKCIPKKYKQISAPNGKAGLDLATEIIPDLIISDVMMPIMDGHQLLQQIRTNANTSHIPVILLTAKAGQDEKEKGLQYGANAYIVKPFSKSELIIRIESLIRERERLQSYYTSQHQSPQNEISTDPWLVEFSDYIKHHFEESLSIEDYCKVYFLSRSQLHRKIKALTGLSTSQYIRSLRMQQAIHLLYKKELPISHVATELGYKTTAHFSNDFKKRYDVSPSRFRESQI